jgi:hypothetical protein
VDDIELATGTGAADGDGPVRTGGTGQPA